MAYFNNLEQGQASSAARRVTEFLYFQLPRKLRYIQHALKRHFRHGAVNSNKVVGAMEWSAAPLARDCGLG